MGIGDRVESEMVSLRWDDPISDREPEHSTFKGLIEKFGEPIYRFEDGRIKGVNESFWAALHAAENIELYEPDEKMFYRYDPTSGLYEPVSTDVIKSEISARLLKYARETDQSRIEEFRKNSFLTHVAAQCRGIVEKRGIFSHQGKRHIHVANGVIVFRENFEADFCEFAPQLYSRNRSPIAFDPTAKCNRFLNEFLLPASSPEDAVLIQKYAGQALLGNNLIQRLLILDGLAGRGKTTFALILQKIIGQQNVSELRTRHLGERFEIFRFLKKLLLVGVDVPGNFLSEKGAHIIKGLVGGDYFDGEQKGGTGSFPISGNFCILITSNSRLQVRLDGDVGAWRRRLLIVRYEGTSPAKKIPNLADQLVQEEGPGILNWCLAGLRDLLADVSGNGDIRLTDNQIAIIDRLLAESGSLRIFLKENISRGYGDVSASEIVEAYAKFCPMKGWNPKPITQVYRDLEGLMLELHGAAKSNSVTRHGKSVRGFRNVTLLQQEAV